jgi:DNA-binding transcriptional MerR regulator
MTGQGRCTAGGLAVPGPTSGQRRSGLACGSADHIERLMTAAALRQLGFTVAELDDLLAVLEELDEGWAASDTRGTLLVELDRFCDDIGRASSKTGRRAEQAVAALRRRRDGLTAAADGWRW